MFRNLSRQFCHAAASKLGGALLALLLTCRAALAANMAFVGTPNPTDTRADSVAQAGYGFYANPSGTATINELGFWVSPVDSGGTGKLAESHTVALYNYNGTNYTEIAQATIPAGAQADATGYAWASISPLVLSDTRQGADYYIVQASQGTDTWGPNFGTNTFSSVDSAFGALTRNGWFTGSNPPGIGNAIGLTPELGNGGYVGANIGFVPEPGSLLLLAIGALGLVCVRRLRRVR